MPTFSFLCGKCGKTFTDLVSADTVAVSCSYGCGGVGSKLFSPTKVLRLAPWLRAENEDANARNRAMTNTPEFRAKLDSGELEPDTGDRYSDNLDGPEGSSCVLSSVPGE